jgi:sterol desaturase/sphingolipid hydroxylase (fatty acid hydroxylase superfamily)
MIDESLYGVRDKRGDWKPNERIEYPPVFVWPVQPVRFLKWLFGFPGYIFPYKAFYMLVGIALWRLMPTMETTKTLSASWIIYVLALNAAMVFVCVGALHLGLYIRKSQGTTFKYSARWPATDNPTFLCRNQTIDNMIWTYASAIPIVSAYQVLMLWAFANGHINIVNLPEHPTFFIGLMLAIPIIDEVHFYLIHRLLHWPALYRWIHKLHHNNVNPGPWSGLAMHPIEHVLYFSSVLMYWVIPGHPAHLLVQLADLQLTPSIGHTGFEKLLFSERIAISTDSYAHYLHHKYFECNYADGVVPLDKWFGTFHDGSPESQEQMNRRFLDRSGRRGARPS